MNAIWIAVAAVSLLGLAFGAVLGYASRRFAVEDDPVVEKSMRSFRKVNVASAVTTAVARMRKRLAAGAKKSIAAPPAVKR